MENIIGSLKLDFHFNPDSGTGDAMKRLEGIADNLVVPVLERIAGEYGSKDIETALTDIDLGTIEEEEIPLALERELRKRLGSPDVPRPLAEGILPLDDSSGHKFSKDAALKEYLSNPSLPWNSESTGFNPASLAAEVLHTIPDFPSTLSGPALARLLNILQDAEFGSTAISAGRAKVSPTGGRANKTVEELIKSLPDAGRQRLDAILSRIEAWRRARADAQVSGIPELRQVPPVSGTRLESNPAAPETHQSSNHANPECRQDSNHPSPQNHPDSIPATPESRQDSSTIAPNTQQSTSPTLYKTNLETDYITAKEPEYSAVQQPYYPAAASTETSIPAIGQGTDFPDSIWEATAEELESFPERMPLQDAGLVILHPFIARFLQNLKYVDETGRFVSGISRARAVHVLRYLTGNDEPHFEHNLILEKVLCDLSPKYFMPLEWEVSDKEKEEARNLLEAVKSHWKVLKESSVRAMQSGFLQRTGSIESDGECLIVRVEGSAMDILMEDLPWEISIISLPWLKKPIFVEWQR